MNIAKIQVENTFCFNCSAAIKNELQKIEQLDFIRLQPKHSLITFNFMNANNVSAALNKLADMGYSEKGEKINPQIKCKTICNCC